MRSVLKACDLEDRFPILAVENNCIVSKDADITVAFEVWIMMTQGLSDVDNFFG